MKRVFCVILALIMVISLVSIPAFAASDDSTVNDLLVYDIYTIGGLEYFSPSVYTGLSQVNIQFGSGQLDFGAARFVIGIKAVTQPSLVRVFIGGNGYVTFNYLYTHNDIYYYESGYILNEWFDNFVVNIRWSNNYDEVVSIESFYFIEQYSNFYELDTMQAHLTGTAWNGEDLSYFVQDAVNETVALPYTSNLTPDSFYGDPPIDGLMYDYFTFDLEVDYAKQFVFTFISTGVWPNYYDVEGMSVFGITLIDGVSYRNLTYTAASALMDSSWKGLPVYRHTIYVDLTDIDLSDCSLMISVMVQGVEEYHLDDEGSVVTDPFWFVRVEEAGYYQSFYEQKWYIPLLNFFYNIYDVVIERLYSIDYAITDKFISLEAKLDSLFGATEELPSLDDQQQAIEDSTGSMDSVGDDINNSREELEAITPEVPEWEDTGLDGFDDIVGAFIQEFRPIFLAIYANDIINQILTYTFLFALGAFILFGER